MNIYGLSYIFFGREWYGLILTVVLFSEDVSLKSVFRAFLERFEPQITLFIGLDFRIHFFAQLSLGKYGATVKLKITKLLSNAWYVNLSGTYRNYFTTIITGRNTQQTQT